MWRSIVAAALIVALGAVSVQARLIKEMEVTRAGRLTATTADQGGGYVLALDNNKSIALGDRESFGPATRSVLDQAVAQKLPVEITGHLLVFNDQGPVFALPLKKIDVKGYKPQEAAPAPQAGVQVPETPPAPGDPVEAGPFKEAALKSNKGPSLNLGLILDGYAFFAVRNWRVVEAGKVCEFRGEINLEDYNERDSKYFPRLKSKDLRDTFRSLTYVANLRLVAPGQVESVEPYVEAVYQDGSRDKLVWKDPPNYYWERIAANKKIKLDYFLGRAAANPKYGKGAAPAE